MSTRFVVLLPAALLVCPTFADIPSEIRVDDGIGERIYIVACDKLYCRPDKETPHSIDEADHSIPARISERARELEQRRNLDSTLGGNGDRLESR